jgi:hypothetical protein
LSAALATVALTSTSGAQAFALHVNAPWNITGINTGTLRTVALVAVAANNHWGAAPIDDSDLYTRADLIGSLAAASPESGDFFVLSFGPGQTETLTITNDGSSAALNPVFVIGDVDIPGATVTVTDGGDLFTNNADALWTGNVLSVLSGSEQGTIGAWAAVQYNGFVNPGRSFTFLIDYTNATFSADSMVIGVYMPGTVVPGPASGLLLVTALLSIGSRFRRR